MSRPMLWAAGIVATAVAIVHGLTAGRYDLFVNELYFIVCGRHPAFGYVDQPPIVPLISAATQFGGTHVWLLRLPAVAAATLLIPLVVAFAGLLGANARGAWLAAVASAVAPMFAAITATLTTSTLEPLAWTALAYCIARALLREEPRMWWWAGAVAGFAFETRYGVVLWGMALAIGILTTAHRPSLRSKDLWIGVAIAFVIALPNALWQALHGFPFLDVIRDDRAGNLTGTPLVFALDQVLALGIVFAPLWIAAIVTPFTSPRLARFRFLAIAFVVTAVLIFASHGKSYYLAGAFPTMFALGAAACTALPVALVAIWAAIGALAGASAMPLVLPIYSPAKLKDVVDHMPFKMRPVETASIGAPLTQTFSWEFGWRELAERVEGIYASLPAADRADAAIFATTYGEAGAIDVYGKDLPPVISGNNQYYLWGPRGHSGAVVIAVNVDPVRWRGWCDSERIVARFGDGPYVMPRERDRPIVLCRGLHPPLAQLWPQLRFYGI